jgi:RNA polymerase sigma factor (TIGR02999 family)
VYDELRQLAARNIADERPGQTLCATALVHEAYLRLVGSDNIPAWDNRHHFFCAAAKAMRRILVDQARRKNSMKRGGDWNRQELNENRLPDLNDPQELLAVDKALTKLADTDEQLANIVECRFFGGLTISDIANSLGISNRTVDRKLAYARAWLYREINNS